MSSPSPSPIRMGEGIFRTVSVSYPRPLGGRGKGEGSVCSPSTLFFKGAHEVQRLYMIKSFVSFVRFVVPLIVQRFGEEEIVDLRLHVEDSLLNLIFH